MLLNTVGERIRLARARAGLSQGELGNLVNSDASQVSRWESDQVIPRGGTRLRIANALKVSTEWLRTGVGEIDPPTSDPLLNDLAAGAKGVAEARETRDRLRDEVDAETQELLTTALTLVIDVARERHVVLPSSKQAAIAVTLAKVASGGVACWRSPFSFRARNGFGALRLTHGEIWTKNGEILQNRFEE